MVLYALVIVFFIIAALYIFPALFLVLPGVVSCMASYMIDPLLDRHMPEKENVSSENCE